MTRGSAVALAAGKGARTLLCPRHKLVKALISVQRGQSFDGNGEGVALIVEARAVPPADPPARDPLEKRFLLELEIDVLPEDENRAPEPSRLVELVFGRLRVAGSDNQEKDV